MTAMRRRRAGSRGSSPSLATSTMPSQATSWASAVPATSSGAGSSSAGVEPVGSKAPTRDARSRIRRTFSSHGSLRHLAAADGGHERVPPRSVGAGHHQILVALRRSHRAHRTPVTDDHAVEAPVRTEGRGQKRALGRGDPVDRVVGGHHHPRAAAEHRLLERTQVHLAECACGHLGAGGEALGLGVVRDVVLHGGRDTVSLDAPDDGRPEMCCEQRVLAERLEVATRERGAVHVDGRREEDVHAASPRLARQHPSVLVSKPRVPRRREDSR